jgi:hypothetical protein
MGKVFFLNKLAAHRREKAPVNSGAFLWPISIVAGGE